MEAPAWLSHPPRVPVSCDGESSLRLTPRVPGTGRRTLQKKRSVADGMIDPDRDLYAIPSQDGNDIYFLSLVDILTHYGNIL